MDNLAHVAQWAFLMVATLAMLSATVWMISTIINSHKLRKLSEDREEYRRSIHNENIIARSVDYSEKILTYLRTLVAHVAVLKFQEFKDLNALSKVTREHTKPLVKEIATSVKNSLNSSNLNLERLMFTNEYLESYIIDMSVYMVKQLLEDTIDGNKN